MLSVKAVPVFAIAILFSGCVSQQRSQPVQSLSIQSIAQELITMKNSDQMLERLVVNHDPQINEPHFYERKDQAQAQNAQRCMEIFNQIGYPTHSLVGPDASQAFWLLVQHADTDPVFQEQVANAMKPAVIQGDAPALSLAMLTDRVRVNTDRPQIYGSQVLYDMQHARAYPKTTENPEQVDQRRAEVGLAPLWKYMNDMSELNYMVNQEQHNKDGVYSPWIYPEGFTDWSSTSSIADQ